MKPGDRRSRADEAVAALASDQHGVVARGQALGVGLSASAIDRRVAAGRWEVLLPRVYRISGAPRSGRQAAMAAALWAGPGALVSHKAAGVLWRIDGLTARRVEITIRSSRNLRSSRMDVHRTDDLIAADRSHVGTIPATSPMRTLIDVAGLLDSDQLELAAEDVIRRGLATPGQIVWRLDALGGKGRRGSGALRRLIDSRDRTTESGREVRLAQLLVRAGLRRPERQYEVRHQGRVVARVDLAYPSARLAIEFDSVRWHSGRRRVDRDSSRGNQLVAIGWATMHVTSMLMDEHPNDVVAQVAATLARQSGAGAM